jgi:3-oxoacyl-[acyl-carrier protein] reductase
MTTITERQQPEHLLVFGASGAIGQSICTMALARGWRVTGVARNMAATPGIHSISLDPVSPDFTTAALAEKAPYTAVCWSQGANRNDSVYDFEAEPHLELYRANVLYILVTMQALLKDKLLASSARLCVISSIWQRLARQSKLSYCVTKSALHGLILSAAADLAKDGHLINAVLPGALETPMTHRNLSADQLTAISSATGFNRLTALDDVASLVGYLCSAANTGITGQFISADLGFSDVRLV